MKKVLVVCAAILVIWLIINWKDIWGYSTLDKAVQSQWKSQVGTVNKDEINRLVLYKDQDQYVFGVFHKKYGRYYYKNDSQSSGWTSQSNNGPAFLVRVEHKQNKGNYIWGALYSEIPIEKFQIEFKNGETREVTAVNNTFIYRIPDVYQEVQEPNLMTTFIDVKAYDKGNKQIKAWRD
ncbi:hypothetical protein J23TS9_56620 [Paenibacillus sp. J23TS9]|uniref:hypothetical protein n=1 Tax=Paenibacillus sp. J23TS9 TaxID=2807193 RepID=UPI001B26F717|nr:hypothetical protein [Paenibacillus sp. J23TS9]GIP30532.1 hypothetical protein J23TS9_56620 [Paenibacillus sp. J23TS9]